MSVDRPTGADDLAARLRLVAESVGPACSVFLALRDEPILYGYELTDAADEIDRLRRWKAEAMQVLDGWDRVWSAVGRPGDLGTFKHRTTLAAVKELRAERDRLREAGDALADRIDPSVGDNDASLDRWEQTRG